MQIAGDYATRTSDTINRIALQAVDRLLAMGDHRLLQLGDLSGRLSHLLFPRARLHVDGQFVSLPVDDFLSFDGFSFFPA